MDIATAITAMPNAAPLAGLPQAWHWGEASGFECAAALSASGTLLFQHSLGSWDEGLVTAVLAYARAHETDLVVTPDRPFALAEGFAYPGRDFDVVGAIGPAAHEEHRQDGALHEATRAVFPTYRFSRLTWTVLCGGIAARW